MGGCYGETIFIKSTTGDNWCCAAMYSFSTQSHNIVWFSEWMKIETLYWNISIYICLYIYICRVTDIDILCTNKWFFPRPKKKEYSQLHSNTLWSQSVKTTKVEHIELTIKKKNITGILSIFHNIIYKEMQNRWNETYNRISNNCDWT